MKIALCIYNLLNVVGGAERSLTELANELSLRGYETFILNYQDLSSGPLPSFYPISPTVKLYTFSENRFLPGNNYASLSAPGNLFSPIVFKLFSKRVRYALLKRLRDLFYRHNIAILHTLGKLLKIPSRESNIAKAQKWYQYNRREIEAWAKVIGHFQPDVVLSFMSRTFFYVAPAMESLSIPHIICYRNNPIGAEVYSNKGEYGIIHQAIIERCTAVVIQHTSFAGHFAEKFRSKIHIIPNVVNPVASNPDITRPGQSNIILNVARIIPHKNQELIIRAFHRIAERHPQWQVHFYGMDASHRANLLELTKSLGLAESVHFFEPVQHISETYRQAEIFAFPSLYEGFPRAMGEAMSFGLPALVIEDCAVCRDLVEQSGGGFIARNDVDDYAHKLEVLISDGSKRREMGKRAAEHVKLFSPGKIYDQWEKLIQDYSI